MRENAASTPADARVISRAVAPQLPVLPEEGADHRHRDDRGAGPVARSSSMARELLSGRAFPAAEGEAEARVALRGGGPGGHDGPCARPRRRRVPPPRPRDAGRGRGEPPRRASTSLRGLPGPEPRGPRPRGPALLPGRSRPLAVVGFARRLCRGKGRTILVDCNRRSPAVESRNLALDSYGPGDAEPLGLGELLAGPRELRRDHPSRQPVPPPRRGGRLGRGPLDTAALDSGRSRARRARARPTITSCCTPRPRPIPCHRCGWRPALRCRRAGPGQRRADAGGPVDAARCRAPACRRPGDRSMSCPPRPWHARNSVRQAALSVCERMPF